MSVCVLDTDVVIAALDGADAHHASAAGALRRMNVDGTVLRLSTVNYAEVLVRPAEDASALRRAVRAIDVLGIELDPPSPAVARDAARLRALGISLADGFALATARAVGGSLASFDRRVRKVLGRAELELAPALR